MNAPILIIGAGGHASVVADALLAGGAELLGFTDENISRHGATVCGVKVLGGDDVLGRYNPEKIVLVNGIGSVGDVSVRRRVQERLQSSGWHFVGVRHPTAIVSAHAHIAAGVQLLAGCVLQTGAVVAEGCIINTAAVVEHDVNLQPWVHIAPGSIVCGDVTIGARSHVGAGAVVLQGVQLGEDTRVGAGSVVLKSFAGGGLLVGVPARVVERGL